MRALHLDFLNPAGRRSRIGLWVLALGIAAGAFTYAHYQRLVADRAALSAQLNEARQAVRRQVTRQASETVDPKRTAQDIQRANAVVARLNVPWDMLFRDLEAAASENVALLAIQPEGGARRVRIAGEARRLEDAFGYVARLEATPGFVNVFLSGHETKVGTPARTVFFTVTADWVAQP